MTLTPVLASALEPTAVSFARTGLKPAGHSENLPDVCRSLADLRAMRPGLDRKSVV